MESVATLRVGVAVERRATGSAWQEWSWYPSAILPATAGDDGWRLLREDDSHAVFHAGHRTIELYRGETAAYKQNLSLDTPVVYVALRPAEDAAADAAVEAFHVTVSPDEALAYSEGDDHVFPVPMPEFVAAWTARFVDAHHQDTPFERRARKRGGAGAHGAAPTNAEQPVARPGWQVPTRHG